MTSACPQMLTSGDPIRRYELIYCQFTGQCCHASSASEDASSLMPESIIFSTSTRLYWEVYKTC